MIGNDVTYAASLLKKGEVVAIPTETVYGLAGNALNPKAVAEIFSVKDRPSFDPLIIHVTGVDQIDNWVKNFPQSLRILAEKFMPGPLTLLLGKKPIIPDLVTSGSATVAIRIPKHPLTHALLSQLDFPLAAPSANPFGYISPTRAAHVEQQLGEKIPYILDGGPCQIGLESTIIGMEEGELVIFRKGGLAIEDIEAVVGPVAVKPYSSSNPKAPGMLKSHYAPSVPLVIGEIENYLTDYPKDQIGFISFVKANEQIPKENQVCLSPQGDFKEAAQNLFAAMRKLDQQSLSIIVAELLPEQDLGRAINDRLRRAAVR